jgi:hypothetical protein
VPSGRGCPSLGFSRVELLAPAQRVLTSRALDGYSKYRITELSVSLIPPRPIQHTTALPLPSLKAQVAPCHVLQTFLALAKPRTPSSQAFKNRGVGPQHRIACTNRVQ